MKMIRIFPFSPMYRSLRKYKQNFCIWGLENTRLIVKKPLHTLRVNVWFGFWAGDGGVIGPSLFESEAGATVKVNGLRYRAMIYDLLSPELEDIDVDDVYFQQDSATCNTSNDTVAILQEKFPDPHTWVHMTPDSLIPPFAVIGETESDGSPTTYVGRCSHEGGTFPARVVSNEHCAYISWAGSQIKKTDYEILVGENYRFVEFSADGIPFRAVRAGNTADGEPLYVGRGMVDKNQKVGKIHPIHQCLFVPYDGEEHCLNSYEVLVCISPKSSTLSSVKNNPPSTGTAGEAEAGEVDVPTWVPASFDHMPSNALIAGKDIDGSRIYVGRYGWRKDLKVPVKIIPAKDIASASDIIEKMVYGKFDVLVEDGYGYSWAEGAKSGDNIPIGAVSTGTTPNGDPIYIGRGHYLDSITPGKVFRGNYYVHIPFDGKEVSISDYEILVKNQ